MINLNSSGRLTGVCTRPSAGDTPIRWTDRPDNERRTRH
jgi:hypothetical protein